MRDDTKLKDESLEPNKLVFLLFLHNLISHRYLCQTGKDWQR